MARTIPVGGKLSGMPTNVITDIPSFNALFEKSVREGVFNVGKIMLRDVMEYVWQQIYQNNTLRKRDVLNENNRYDRTYQFWNAIKGEFSNSIVNGKTAYGYKVYIDKSVMIQDNMRHGFGRHMGYMPGSYAYFGGAVNALGNEDEDGGGEYTTHWYGRDIRDWLVNWIEEGNRHRFAKNTGSKFAAVSYEGIHMFKQTQNRIKDKYSPEISKYVSAKSKVKIGIGAIVEGRAGVTSKPIIKP